jgi:hypothetical protein
VLRTLCFVLCDLYLDLVTPHTESDAETLRMRTKDSKHKAQSTKHKETEHETHGLILQCVLPLDALEQGEVGQHFPGAENNRG